MLVVPPAARLHALVHLDLVVSDRPDVPQRVMATCCRRQGAVVALVFTRGPAAGTAELELAIEVEPRLRQGLIDRIAGLVDVLEVRVRPPVALVSAG
jgi:acetolactate synthase regulatory subunit